VKLAFGASYYFKDTKSLLPYYAHHSKFTTAKCWVNIVTCNFNQFNTGITVDHNRVPQAWKKAMHSSHPII
jgi:hypothetical protein